MSFINALLRGSLMRKHRDGSAVDEAVVSEAREKARRIIMEAEVFTKRTSLDIERALKALTDSLESESRQRMEEVAAKYERLLDASAQKLEKTALDHVQEIAEISKNQVKAIEKSVSARAQTELDIVIDSLKVEKRERLEALEKKLVMSMPEILAQVTGRTLSLSGHEKLIHDALERAARDGLWITK